MCFVLYALDLGFSAPGTWLAEILLCIGAGRLSAYGKMTHGCDGSIERRFDLLEEHEAIEICGK